MHTYEKDEIRVHYNSDLSGPVLIETDGGFTFDGAALPEGFLRAWLNHAGYMLVRKPEPGAVVSPEELVARLPESLWRNVDELAQGLHGTIDQWKAGDLSQVIAFGRVRSAAFGMTQQSRFLVSEALRYLLGGDAGLSLRAAALLTLDLWEQSMDKPVGPPLEIHHLDIHLLRAALSLVHGEQEQPSSPANVPE